MALQEPLNRCLVRAAAGAAPLDLRGLLVRVHISRQTPYVALVHLDLSRESVAAGSHHRPPELVQPRLGSLVRAESKRVLPAERALTPLF